MGTIGVRLVSQPADSDSGCSKPREKDQGGSRTSAAEADEAAEAEEETFGGLCALDFPKYARSIRLLTTRSLLLHEVGLEGVRRVGERTSQRN